MDPSGPRAALMALMFSAWKNWKAVLTFAGGMVLVVAVTNYSPY